MHVDFTAELCSSNSETYMQGLEVKIKDTRREDSVCNDMPAFGVVWDLQKSGNIGGEYLVSIYQIVNNNYCTSGAGHVSVIFYTINDKKKFLSDNL